MTEANTLLLLPHLQVQNANAISGPFSWGFPPPTAFTGFIHALERRLSAQWGSHLEGVGIVCHRFEAQAYRPNKRSHRVFALTRNPTGKDGGAPAIVEEGRAHLEISLLVGVREYLNDDDRAYFAEDAQTAVHGMRLAGGSLLPEREGKRFQAYCLTIPSAAEDRRAQFRKLRRRLLPGFALVQREDLLAARLDELRQDNGEANALEALLDLCCLHHEPPQNSDTADERPPQVPAWTARKRYPGWLVPLPIGYAGISELYAPGEVANARDAETPFRFVESLYSLGQWIGPHRLESLQQLLWHTEADAENGIYRCINRYAQTLPSTASD